MVVVSYSGREINAKIVYYGPGLSGKTTNLEKIYDSVPESNRGRMVSMKTQTDRTLFFDLLPLDLGELSGMKTRFLLYTVPGQVYYNATRKLVLKGVDALVFVADSTPDKMAENRESLTNLEQNLKSYGLDLKTIPWVMQFNKRDLPEALPVAQMNKELNRWGVPTFEAQAANGTGIFETLRGVSKILLARISKDVIERDRGVSGAKRSAEKESPDEKGQAPKGKLIQALKRGKAKPEPEPESEAPMLSDGDLVEEAPQAPPSYHEPTPFREQPVVTKMPPAREEMVMSDEDLVIEREVPRIGSREDSDLTEGEIERESSYEGDREADRVAAMTAGGKSVVVPIDLGSLPNSGRLRVTFEFTIDIVDTPSKKKPNTTHMRDLDTVS
jgi:signal recognition particle receptor subunit beta